ncbi:MAG: hypothetical protein EOM91_12975 [Sphingobacteriia bacterium]|nr:hypothetical protein [Sphingobacteriia bacterium]
MPSGFDFATPIVDVGANSRPLRWKTHQWILWPVYAYKVLLPVRRDSALNVFQRAVLDLCQAGARAPESIANRLALPADLVRFLSEQLLSMDLLDEDAAPTQRALRILAEEDEPPQSKDVFHVFVDGHTHRLWPRLHCGNLPVINADIEKKGSSAVLHRGNPGNPRKDHARFLLPDSADRVAAQPSAREILKVAHQHGRRVRDFANEWRDAPPADRGLDKLSLKQVRLVSTIGDPIFVAVYIFMPDDARHCSWLVTDPCGLGVTDVLRAGIASLAAEDRCGVRKIIERLTGEAWHVDESELAHFLAEASRAAVERVAHRLGDAADLLPTDALRLLADADERLESARTSASSSTKQLEGFYGNSYAALEGVFGWLLSLYPDPSMLAALAPSPEDNARLLQRLADSLGFDTSERTLALLRTSRAVVKGAICHGNKDLQGKLAACLLASRFNQNHPLASLAVAYPSALERLASLRRRRNAGQHDTDSVPSVEAASADRDHLFDLLRALVGSGPAEPSSADSSQLSVGADMLQQRIRAQAVQAVQVDYPMSDERLELRTRLIDMHAATIPLQLLARIDEAPLDSLRTLARDFVVAASIVMEALLAAIERSAPSHAMSPGTISDDRAENALHIAAVATSLGFALDDTGCLPEALTHARAERIRRAASGKAETLSARLIALLLSADRKPEHPLREVARTSPAFLLHIGRLLEVRGHADEVRIDTSEALVLKQSVAEDVRAVLDALDEVTE